MSAQPRVWLTKDAYDHLSAELATLRAARDADSTEPDPAGTGGDPEYISQTGRRHARIRHIQDLLDQAVVGRTPPDDGTAEPGMVLTVRFDDEDEAESFLLAARDCGNINGVEVYSPDSPLGTALIGAQPGDERTYHAPNGATVHVTLLRAVPYGQHAEHILPDNEK